MTHFLFPTNDMVETPVSALTFRSRKDVMINAIKSEPFVEVNIFKNYKNCMVVYTKCLTHVNFM